MMTSGNQLIHFLNPKEFSFIKEQLGREIVRYETVLKQDPKLLTKLETAQGLKFDRLKNTFERFNKLINSTNTFGDIIVELNNTHTRAVQRVLTAYIYRCSLIDEEYSKRIEKEIDEAERKRLEEYKSKLPILAAFSRDLFAKMEGGK